ncbi:hypothetical protein JZ751_026635, partial [Albula glossodonta]
GVGQFGSTASSVELELEQTTWERPSSTPGTPKTPLRQKNSTPTVNGFHSSGSPLHQLDLSHVRKASSDQQEVQWKRCK